MLKTSPLDADEKKSEQKQLKQCIQFILEECRMVLPGIQAMFGFQLIAVFNEQFNTLQSADKFVHLAAMLFTVASVGLLMGPAAYHRLNSPEGVPPELCKVGTGLVCVGMATLSVSMSLEMYLVTKLICESTIFGIAAGAITFIFLCLLWYIFPLQSKRKHHASHHHVNTSSLM